MPSLHDLSILRDLGKRKAEIGSLPVQKEKFDLWRRLNRREQVRPLVWINELPWHELSRARPDALAPRCEDTSLHGIEMALRRELFQWDEFPGDMIVEPVWYVGIQGGPRGSYADYGIHEAPFTKPGTHDVCYRPVIKTEADVDRIRTPEVWVDHEATKRAVDQAEEIFADVLPVKRRGIVHQWHSPWDQIIHWYGIEQLYEDMVENPDLIHRLMSRFMKALEEVVERQVALGMLDVGNGNWRVGSGGMGVSDELPGEGAAGRRILPRDQWGCSTAQIFSEVSPAMHEEFSLQYERPLLSRYGLAYYGCCEPLHFKIGILRSIPNLRKISMSPWVDLAQASELTGRDYVLSFKPNPAHLATDVFHEEQVRAYLENAAKALSKNPAEFILKDVSTIRGDAARLSRWEKIAMEVAMAA